MQLERRDSCKQSNIEAQWWDFQYECDEHTKDKETSEVWIKVPNEYMFSSLNRQTPQGQCELSEKRTTPPKHSRKNAGLCIGPLHDAIQGYMLHRLRAFNPDLQGSRPKVVAVPIPCRPRRTWYQAPALGSSTETSLCTLVQTLESSWYSEAKNGRWPKQLGWNGSCERIYSSRRYWVESLTGWSLPSVN